MAKLIVRAITDSVGFTVLAISTRLGHDISGGPGCDPPAWGLDMIFIVHRAPTAHRVVVVSDAAGV